MKYNDLIPEFVVSNIDISRDFYVNMLGFKVEYEREEDKFIFLSLGNIQLMLEEGSEDELKKVAMHVAASKPEFVNPEDVSADVVEHERQIQIDIAINSGKPKEIAEKMVEGRMKKFTGEVSLTGQAFVMDPSQSVGDYLKSVNTKVSNFIRLEVGEGIEKVEEDFAAEVAKITGGNA